MIVEEINLNIIREISREFFRRYRNEANIFPQAWLNPDIKIETIEVKKDDDN